MFGEVRIVTDATPPGGAPSTETKFTVGLAVAVSARVGGVFVAVGVGGGGDDDAAGDDAVGDDAVGGRDVREAV